MLNLPITCCLKLPPDVIFKDVLSPTPLTVFICECYSTYSSLSSGLNDSPVINASFDLCIVFLLQTIFPLIIPPSPWKTVGEGFPVHLTFGKPPIDVREMSRIGEANGLWRLLLVITNIPPLYWDRFYSKNFPADIEIT
jgi:hypothetical protein